MTTLCIAAAIALLACLLVVSVGCRAILCLCGSLNRDQRNGYKVQPDAKRPAPRWIGGRK